MLDKYINASDTILGMNARNLLYIDRKGPRVTNSMFATSVGFGVSSSEMKSAIVFELSSPTGVDSDVGY